MQAHDQASRTTGATSHHPVQLQSHPAGIHRAAPGTGRRLKVAVGSFVGVLALAYGGTLAIHHRESHDLAKTTA